ncbi:hypothetical protein B5807_03964 [Epicoccum nigrum]|uniref:Dystroglycan-type cadherin-like domain-containing protein n=1 Tax=Epicoccum nigrum TaxID=105696 RepID=A0A1Y2M6G6_EPING|nr:hypothetical protein B5807_03964 [Epicoccum nigrum]
MAASLLFAMAVRIATLAALLVIVSAAPRVSYPLNAQFPPIGRIGQPYLFQFASTTFNTDSGNPSYSLKDNPAWLSIDGKTGTLSGTPGARDVGSASFTVTATGQDGVVANMESELLVTKDDSPKVVANISQALSTAGPLSGPTTIVAKASQDFEISFPSNFFDSAKKLSYFATLSDHTPLPAWISFDASSLRFAGTIPPTSIPQTFGMLLIASDTPGYAASTVQFSLSIGVHELYFQPAIQTLNVTKGGDVLITDLKSKLNMDQSLISDRDIRSASAELPDWLRFESDSFKLTGTAPSEVTSQDISISVEDIYGESAQYTVHLNIISGLFSGAVGTLNITAGAFFKIDLPQSILSQDDEVVTIDFGLLAAYIRFDPARLVISGTVPEGTKPQTVQCTISATSKNGNFKEDQAFNIALLQSPDPTTNSAAPGHGDTFNTTTTDQGGQYKGAIVGIVLASIAGAALLMACIFCMCRRRKQDKSYLSPKPTSQRSPRKSQISRPTFIPIGWPDIEEEDLEKGKDHEEDIFERTPEHAPKLNVSLPHENRDSASGSDSIGDADTRILEDFDESSWGYIRDDSAPSDRPHDSMKIPVELAKRSSENPSNSFRKHTRRTTTVYRDQIHRSSGLPVNRRITGMGARPPHLLPIEE